MTPEDITKILEEASVGHPGVSQIKLIWEHKFPGVVAAIMALEEGAHPNVDKQKPIPPRLDKEGLINLIMETVPKPESRESIHEGEGFYHEAIQSWWWNEAALNELAMNELWELYYKAIK